jgi:hypothetical protein
MGRPPVVLKTEFPTIHNLDDLPEEWWPDPGLMGESNEVFLRFVAASVLAHA